MELQYMRIAGLWWSGHFEEGRLDIGVGFMGSEKGLKGGGWDFGRELEEAKRRSSADQPRAEHIRVRIIQKTRRRHVWRRPNKSHFLVLKSKHILVVTSPILQVSSLTFHSSLLGTSIRPVSRLINSQYRPLLPPSRKYHLP
jgi:hypothetical protein